MVDNESGSYKTRKTSKLLFWYFFREFSIPLLCCLSGFVILFIVADVFDLLQDFLGSGLPYSKILLYFAMKQPENIVNIVPMSIILSGAFMMARMGRYHEITALRSSGLSLVRCCLPVWLISLALAVMVFVFSESVVPYSKMMTEKLATEMDNYNSDDYSGENIVYLNGSAHRHWYVENFKTSGECKGVMVKQYRIDGVTLSYEIVAESVNYVDKTWYFKNCSVTYFSEDSLQPVGEPKNYKTYSQPEIDEDPQEMKNSLRPAEELTIKEIMKIINNEKTLPVLTKRRFLTIAYHRMVFPLACIIAAMLGCSLSVSRENSSVMLGVAVAVGTMIAYYLVSHIFILMGKNGMISPFFASLLPTLTFFCWSGYEVYKRG